MRLNLQTTFIRDAIVHHAIQLKKLHATEADCLHAHTTSKPRVERVWRHSCAGPSEARHMQVGTEHKQLRVISAIVIASAISISSASAGVSGLAALGSL